MDQLFLTVNAWITGGSVLAGLGCFLWGMVSVLFSPCHLAAIPLMVGYVAGQEQGLGPRHGAHYALAFTTGLFLTIAAVGVISSLLGRMLGDVGPYWTILVGAVLIWVALDMLGLAKSFLSGGLMARLKVRGLGGAFLLGLAYGVLSGSCTFGFIAPILAIITIQEQIATGLLFILLFGLGHCLPIAVAGSSTALVQRLLDNRAMQAGSSWFRRVAGLGIALMGVYFLLKPFLEA
ncbi:MAG: sulfite exporter TauE/SafE family protein [Desulfarculus sp.]|nr:sulfite exporter TauE/SafE family protein [Desulfarculus sp.]